MAITDKQIAEMMAAKERFADGRSQSHAPLSQSKKPITDNDIIAMQSKSAPQESSFLDPITAAVASGAREQTFGLSQKAERLLGLEDSINKAIERNPVASGAGRIGSYFIPIPLPGKAKLLTSSALGGAIAKGARAVESGLSALLGGSGLAKLASGAARIPGELAVQAGAQQAARNLIGEGGRSWSS
jgi:hypothetical protein